MQTDRWIWLPVAVISVPAHAVTYFTTEQAQQAIFPGARLSAAFVSLNDDQAREIEKASGAGVRRREVRAWKVEGGGWFVLDDVVGKHELITYAVGIDAAGSVRQVEIVDYRESYGYEIRNPDWRRQFVGKSHADPVALGQDIRNISGATLSCRHLAEGVRRVLATHAVALR